MVFAKGRKLHALGHIIGQCFLLDIRCRQGRFFSFCFFRFRNTLLLGCQVNTAFLADFLIVAVNIGDQLPGSLADSLQTGSQLLQLLALTPAGNIAKAVFGSLNAIIFANRIRDTFSLYFLGVPVLFTFLQKLLNGLFAADEIQTRLLRKHDTPIFWQF